MMTLSQSALGGSDGLQDCLGAINDCVTARDLVKRDKAASAAIGALVPGREEQFRKFWRARFGPAAQKRWLAWIESPEKAGTGKAKPGKRQTHQ